MLGKNELLDDPTLQFLGSEVEELDEGDDAGDGEDAQNALIDQLGGGNAGDVEDEDDDEEGSAAAGETDEGDQEDGDQTDDQGGEDEGQNQAAAQLPEWSKPVQKLQQEFSNTRREVLETKSMLQEVLQEIRSGRTNATPHAEKTLEAQADALDDILRELDDPKFDAVDGSPALFKKLIGEIKSVRQENRSLKSELEKSGAATKATEAQRAQWAKWAAENPEIGLKRGQQLFEEATDEALQEDPNLEGSALAGAARLIWLRKCKAEKAQRQTAKNPQGQKNKITAGKNLPRTGGKIAPTEGRGNGQTRATTRTLEQKLSAGAFNLAATFK